MVEVKKRVDFIVLAALILPVGFLFTRTRRLHKKIEPPPVKVRREFIVIKAEDLYPQPPPEPVEPEEPEVSAEPPEPSEALAQ